MEDAPICNAGVSWDLRQHGVTEKIIPVLQSFNFERFWVIHNRILALRRRNLTQCQDTKISRGGVYIVKTRGPNVEPCDTPDNNDWISDKVLRTDTLWEYLFSKHNWNHSSTF